MRVLVTGGAGFIGSAYVRELLSGAYPAWQAAQVTVLDLLTYAGNLANLAPVDGRFTFVHGDIGDRALLEKVVPGHDAVVSFAAESHVDRSIAGAADFLRTNVLGVQRLFDACLEAGVGRVVHVSTDEVYGSIGSGSWDETAPLAPNSPYAASKASSDLLARSYHVTHGLPVVITRCGNNYGPYQHPEKAVPRFVTRLLTGGTVPLYGDGTNVRDWVHVTDHCQGIQVAAEHGAAGEVYHVAGTRELTNIELTDRILAACGAGWDRVEKVPDRPGHDRRYSLADAKLRTLGYAPRISFEKGLAETVRWYAKNIAWWQKTGPR
uniref:dTDP-glucose 4,6-dehydratase n=1 Tax=Streptomyces sp. SANK 62799 TaxID=701528 RepID=E1CG47_9ACTN|nr:putative NDP-glucose 4,6-dehydratase [Streptomyces sp. SANK 62799]